MKYLARVTEVGKAGIAKVLDNVGMKFNPGTILVDIPMLNVTNFPCRYGMSLPYVKVKKGDVVLVEPMSEDLGDLFYTGIPDLNAIDEIEYSEPLVKGNKLGDYLQELTDAINDHATKLGVTGAVGQVITNSSHKIDLTKQECLRILPTDSCG